LGNSHFFISSGFSEDFGVQLMRARSFSSCCFKGPVLIVGDQARQGYYWWLASMGMLTFITIYRAVALPPKPVPASR
jgi:hypothetical protein